MTEQTFDALTRHAAGVPRRGSLLTLGGAGLAALAGPSTTEASKSGKKAKNLQKARKQAKKKCKKQVAQCTEFIEDLCAGERNSDVCEAKLSPCCEFLAQCQVTALFDCIFENAA